MNIPIYVAAVSTALPLYYVAVSTIYIYIYGRLKGIALRHHPSVVIGQQHGGWQASPTAEPGFHELAALFDKGAVVGCAGLPASCERGRPIL